MFIDSITRRTIQLTRRLTREHKRCVKERRGEEEGEGGGGRERSGGGVRRRLTYPQLALLLLTFANRCVLLSLLLHKRIKIVSLACACVAAMRLVVVE